MCSSHRHSHDNDSENAKIHTEIIRFDRMNEHTRAHRSVNWKWFVSVFCRFFIDQKLPLCERVWGARSGVVMRAVCVRAHINEQIHPSEWDMQHLGRQLNQRHWSLLYILTHSLIYLQKKSKQFHSSVRFFGRLCSSRGWYGRHDNIPKRFTYSQAPFKRSAEFFCTELHDIRTILRVTPDSIHVDYILFHSFTRSLAPRAIRLLPFQWNSLQWLKRIWASKR